MSAAHSVAQAAVLEWCLSQRQSAACQCQVSQTTLACLITERSTRRTLLDMRMTKCFVLVDPLGSCHTSQTVSINEKNKATSNTNFGVIAKSLPATITLKSNVDFLSPLLSSLDT
eukprot:3556115-Amphidinium_carterae.1